MIYEEYAHRIIAHCRSELGEDIAFIYGLADPRTGRIRYIGKSIRPIERLGNHVNEPTSQCHRSHWLAELKALGLSPALVILEAVPSDKSWQQAERVWIASGRSSGWPLVNNTDGGDGVAGLSSESRARIARAWTGRKHRPETIEKLRSARKNFRHTAETRKRMSEARKGRSVTWGRKIAEAVSKFSPAEVAAIESRLAAGEGVTNLAAEFGVHRTTISKIKKGSHGQRS